MTERNFLADSFHVSSFSTLRLPLSPSRRASSGFLEQPYDGLRDLGNHCGDRRAVRFRHAPRRRARPRFDRRQPACRTHLPQEMLFRTLRARRAWTKTSHPPVAFEFFVVRSAAPRNVMASATGDAAASRMRCSPSGPSPTITYRVPGASETILCIAPITLCTPFDQDKAGNGKHDRSRTRERGIGRAASFPCELATTRFLASPPHLGMTHISRGSTPQAGNQACRIAAHADVSGCFSQDEVSGRSPGQGRSVDDHA